MPTVVDTELVHYIQRAAVTVHIVTGDHTVYLGARRAEGDDT